MLPFNDFGARLCFGGESIKAPGPRRLCSAKSAGGCGLEPRSFGCCSYCQDRGQNLPPVCSLYPVPHIPREVRPSSAIGGHALEPLRRGRPGPREELYGPTSFPFLNANDRRTQIRFIQTLTAQFQHPQLFKENARYEALDAGPLPANCNILADDLIQFTGDKAQKDCPYPLRRVKVWDAVAEREIVLLTNLLEFGSTTIAAIYKDRWEIELFFKALKQNRDRAGHGP